MKYYSYPTSYNWGSMNNYSGSAATAQLMKDIGTAVLTDYDCEFSSAYDSNAAAAFTGTFGYSSAILAAYNYNTILTEIMLFNRPVYLGGYKTSPTGDYIGHAWVCDGVQEVSYNMCYEINGIYYSTYYSGSRYLHMNWGWNGLYNGFFANNNFNTSNGNYNYYLTQITNIIP